MSTVSTRRCTACGKRTASEGQCHRCGAFPGDTVPQLDRNITALFPTANPWLLDAPSLRQRVFDVLRRFALMHRLNDDPDELACVRGTASDMTVLTSRDFTEAMDLLLDLGDSEFAERIDGDDRYVGG